MGLATKAQISKLRLAHLDFDGKLNSKPDLFSSFLAVQDSSISDIVGLSVGRSQLTIRAYIDYIDYNDCNDHRDSDLDLD